MCATFILTPNSNLALNTITDCNDAKPNIANTALTYKIYNGLNMPISGMNTFVVQPNGDSDTNFSQLAQCVYSTTKINMGQLFTRRYVAETGWSSWEKIMSNSDLKYRLVLNDGSTALQTPYSGNMSYRLQISRDGDASIFKTVNSGASWERVKTL